MGAGTVTLDEGRSWKHSYDVTVDCDGRPIRFTGYTVITSHGMWKRSDISAR